MDQLKIKTLLQKYYDGNTSFEEEDELYIYFLENDVPASLQSDKDQFLGIRDLKLERIPVPEDLNDSVIANLKGVQNASKVRTLPKRALYSAVSVAASVLLIASALLFTNRQPDLGSFEDPELAYAETKEAIELVSKYFAKGTNQMAGLTKMEEAMAPLTALSKVEESRKSLQHLKAFDRGLKQSHGLVNFEKQKEQ